MFTTESKSVLLSITLMDIDLRKPQNANLEISCHNSEVGNNLPIFRLHHSPPEIIFWSSPKLLVFGIHGATDGRERTWLLQILKYSKAFEEGESSVPQCFSLNIPVDLCKAAHTVLPYLSLCSFITLCIWEAFIPRKRICLTSYPLQLQK